MPPTPHSGAHTCVSLPYSVCHSHPASTHAPQSFCALHTPAATGHTLALAKQDTSATWHPFMHWPMAHLHAVLAFPVHVSQLPNVLQWSNPGGGSLWHRSQHSPSAGYLYSMNALHVTPLHLTRSHDGQAPSVHRTTPAAPA